MAAKTFDEWFGDDGPEEILSIKSAMKEAWEAATIEKFTSTNSDYAAAIRALSAFAKESTDEITIPMFRRFCEDRLNSAKPNCT